MTVNVACLLYGLMLEAQRPGELVVTERRFLPPESHAVHSVQLTDAKAGGRGTEAPDFQAGSR